MMYGPQVLLELDTERSSPVWKCVVCDAETVDESRIDQHVRRCGAVVLKEHHGMAKTAWLAGIRLLKERRARRRLARSIRIGMAAVVEANRSQASEGRAAAEHGDDSGAGVPKGSGVNGLPVAAPRS